MVRGDKPHLNKKLSLAGHGDFQSNLLGVKGFLVPNGTLRNAEGRVKNDLPLSLSETKMPKLRGRAVVRSTARFLPVGLPLQKLAIERLIVRTERARIVADRTRRSGCSDRRVAIDPV